MTLLSICRGCRGWWDQWGCRGSKTWKITTEDFRVIQAFEFSIIFMFWKKKLVESWNIMLNFSTFSVGGCWGQPILLFEKLVDETKISKYQDFRQILNSLHRYFFICRSQFINYVLISDNLFMRKSQFTFEFFLSILQIWPHWNSKPWEYQKKFNEVWYCYWISPSILVL